MFFSLFSRIYLNDLSNLINRKDKRSIRKWCTKHRLQIFQDTSGEFVNENEFELTYNMPIIIKLKAKYGDNWQEYYQAYEKGTLYEMLDLDNNKIEKKNYKPKGKLSLKIFGGSSK